MSIKINSPINSQKFLLKDTVLFTGTANTNIVKVELIADNKFPLGSTTVNNGKWSLNYKFNKTGKRQILVKGFDQDNQEVDQDEIVIILRSPYNPPSSCRSILGNIVELLNTATPITDKLEGKEIILKLPTGQIYIEADMDIDADGSPRVKDIDPEFGQLGTNLTYPGRTGQNQYVNAEEVPYFVLPGGWYKQFGINLGDIGAVLYNGKIEYAVFADVGPTTKIGEGSIALSQSLGNDPFRNGKAEIGIDKDVIYIVFPGSGNGTPQTVKEIRDKGKELFIKLGGKV